MPLAVHDAPLWILDHLPAWSLRTGPYGLALWQWIFLPIAAIGALLVGALVSTLLGRLISPLAKRSAYDQRLIQMSRGPLTLFIAVGVAHAVLVSFDFADPAHAAESNALVAILLFGVFWMVWRLVDLGASHLATTSRIQDNAGARSLLSLGSKGAKVLLFLLGAITALQQLGVHVESLVAGLGIGGLAFALAAQKTLENLFGSVTLGVDRPLSIGDTVKIDDFTATVEQIGLRSTRFRTIDQTVITLPNGRLADMRIENISQRSRIRLTTHLALAYGTDSAKLGAIIDDARAFLLARPKVETSTVSVALIALADWSLTIEVIAWMESTDADEFTAFRQDALLGLLAIVEKHGARFAFPARDPRLDPISVASAGPPAKASS